MMNVLSSPYLRPGTPLVYQLAAQLAANDCWDGLHHPLPRRRPPVRRPGASLPNSLAVLVRELPRPQFRAWCRFLHAAGIHPADFRADIVGPTSFSHVPFGRLLRYRDWLLARGYPDLLVPVLAPPAPAVALALAA